jgi:hypothetical protein
MEGNFPTSTYNKKTGIHSSKKKEHDGFLLRSSSAYNCFNQEKNQPVRIIEPVHIIGT